MEQQREVDRRSMESIVEKSLGDVQGCDTCRLVQKSVKHKLMLAYRLDRQLVAVLERLLDVVGAEDCKRSDHPDILPAEHKDICVRTKQHSEITHEAGNLAACLTSATALWSTSACRAESTRAVRRRCTPTRSIRNI